jgi:hypothetical protein
MGMALSCLYCIVQLRIRSGVASIPDTTALHVPSYYSAWRSNLVHFFNDLKIK